MAMIRALVAAQITELADDEVEIRMSTGAIARDGHILVPEGVVLDNYLKNPIQLWQHDPEYPVGINREIRVDGDGVVARTKFAPLGISPKADEVRGLVKAGIVSAVSVGFEPLDGDPLDPKRPRGGHRFTRWELLECSFVSVPADTGAIVTAREIDRGEDMAEWKCGAARNLPIDDSDAWDGAAAEASIFEHAGGDEFDPAKARRGFLAYDASKPKERGSYKLPIAHVVDGELKVPKGALRAAASRLPQADIGDAKDSAEKVLRAYEKKAGIGDDERSGKPVMIRAHRGGMAVMVRGLYEIGRLAWMLDCLCDAHYCAQIEAALEGDASQVPAMIAKAMQDLGAALVAMTEEEVAEALAGTEADDDDGGDLDDEATTIIVAAANPALKRFLIGKHRAAQIVKARAGKKLSAATRAAMQEAIDHHSEAMAQHRAAIRAHQRGMDCMRDLMAANDNGDDEEGDGEGDDEERQVPGNGDGDENDSQQIQTSSGTGQSGGSDNDRDADYRRRQAELLALTQA